MFFPLAFVKFFAKNLTLGAFRALHAKASVEWVVLSGKFDVETGPVFHVPGHERTRETLVAGSFMVIPKGQPHKVHCLEPGVVFVSYEGNPDITPIAEHDA